MFCFQVLSHLTVSTVRRSSAPPPTASPMWCPTSGTPTMPTLAPVGSSDDLLEMTCCRTSPCRSPFWSPTPVSAYLPLLTLVSAYLPSLTVVSAYLSLQTLVSAYLPSLTLVSAYLALQSLVSAYLPSTTLVSAYFTSTTLGSVYLPSPTVCCKLNQSMNVLFYVCSQQGDISPPPYLILINPLFKGLWTINLTIEVIKLVLYKISLSLLPALKSYPFFWNNSVVIGHSE